MKGRTFQPSLTKTTRSETFVNRWSSGREVGDGMVPGGSGGVGSGRAARYKDGERISGDAFAPNHPGSESFRLQYLRDPDVELLRCFIYEN
jgi:hypothetical protein